MVRVTLNRVVAGTFESQMRVGSILARHTSVWRWLAVFQTFLAVD